MSSEVVEDAFDVVGEGAETLASGIDFISKAASIASTLFKVSIVVAILSIPLNIIDFPVNLMILFFITVFNGLIVAALLIANAILIIGIVFPLRLMEILINGMIINSVNAVINSIINGINELPGVTDKYELKHSDYLITAPSFPKVSPISIGDMLIRFTWDVTINPFDGAEGLFTVKQVDSGLPDKGIWQLVVIPAFNKLRGKVQSQFSSISPPSFSNPFSGWSFGGW